MRVGYDATTLSSQRSGIGRYTLELLRALAATQPADEYVLLAHRRPDPDATVRGRGRISRLRGPGFPSRVAWMQTVLPAQLVSARLDVCHFTNYHAPLLATVPLVVTIHDLSLLVSPSGHPSRRVATMRPLLKRTARRAAVVITPTESARDDVVRLLGVAPERVHVIPEAAPAWMRRVTDQTELDRVSMKYDLSGGFPLFVGTLEPRKNLVRLVDAYARLRRDGLRHPLVLAGGLGWKYEDLLARVAEPEIRGAVRLLGHIPDDDLPALLSLAGAFVYPSLHEGFGLPIVEAMACGTPTVTSDRGAMREVAGDAAVLVDPTDVVSIANGLARALSDTATRDRLRAAGPHRASGFSWERAALQTSQVYHAVAGAPA